MSYALERFSSVANVISNVSSVVVSAAFCRRKWQTRIFGQIYGSVVAQTAVSTTEAKVS